jgi:large repetitive protein
MTLRRDGLCGLVIVGLLSLVLILAACGAKETTTVPPASTTVPPVSTTEAPTTTTEAVTTTTQAATTTTQAVTTTSEAVTTTTQAVTTTTAAPPAPAITSLSPAKGPVAGGTTVVITGTDFLGLSGGGAVTFGGINATSYTLNSATKITATAPAHAAGKVRVKVITPYGISANTAADDFSYVAPPAITALDPASGSTSGGTTVVITGTDFVGLSGAGAVTFGGANATKYTVNSPTKITATAPAHSAGTVQVKVTTAYGASANTAADDFTYGNPPTITALSPATGPSAGGTSVVITGTGLTGATGVTFGDSTSTFTVDSNTQITATAPAHAAGKVRVKVTTPYGTSANTAADDFTYAAPPAITALNPTSGPTSGGTSVVITGTALTGVTGVTFGDTVATFTIGSDTQITATAPAHAAGTVPVKVTSPDGASADTAADDFTYVGPPTITGLDPTTGPVAGGTSVVISGTDLTGVTSVTFGGTAATFTIDSNTRITAIAPAHEAGQARVEIAGANGAGPVDPNAPAYYFVYVDVPVVTALTPSRGPLAGGNTVVITGREFVDVTQVVFGEAKADYTVDSPTQITAVAPSAMHGTVRVEVTALGGVSPDDLTDDYTYSFVPGPPVPPLSGFWYKVLELLDEFFSPLSKGR